MAANSRTIVLANSLTLTATPSTPTYIIPPEAFTALDGFVKVGTVSGTTPTLDITIDKGVRTPTSSDTVGQDVSAPQSYSAYTWLPWIKLRQMTATNQIQQFNVVGSGSQNPAVATSLAAATAGTPNSGSIGSVWRITFTVGGTNPSFASIVAAVNLLP